MARRTAVVLINGNNILIGHAPNRKYELNTWDLPKGHCENEESYVDCGWRELYEETGFKKEDLSISKISMSKEFKYAKRDKMVLMFVEIKKRPQKKPKAHSFFTDSFGHEFPEMSEYKWVDFGELPGYLYLSHLITSIPNIFMYFNN